MSAIIDIGENDSTTKNDSSTLNTDNDRIQTSSSLANCSSGHNTFDNETGSIANNTRTINIQIAEIDRMIECNYPRYINGLEFLFVLNLIFAITFIVFFLSPVNNKYDFPIFIGEMLLLPTTFIIGYGLLTVSQRCTKRNIYYIKMLYINLTADVLILGWFFPIETQIGIVVNVFTILSTVFILRMEKFMDACFEKRRKLYFQLKLINGQNHSNIDTA